MKAIVRYEYDDPVISRCDDAGCCCGKFTPNLSARVFCVIQQFSTATRGVVLHNAAVLSAVSPDSSLLSLNVNKNVILAFTIWPLGKLRKGQQ